MDEWAQQQLEQELQQTLISAIDKAKPVITQEELTTLLYATGMTHIYPSQTQHTQLSLFNSDWN